MGTWYCVVVMSEGPSNLDKTNSGAEGGVVFPPFTKEELNDPNMFSVVSGSPEQSFNLHKFLFTNQDPLHPSMSSAVASGSKSTLDPGQYTGPKSRGEGKKKPSCACKKVPAHFFSPPNVKALEGEDSWMNNAKARFNAYRVRLSALSRSGALTAKTQFSLMQEFQEMASKNQLPKTERVSDE